MCLQERLVLKRKDMRIITIMLLLALSMGAAAQNNKPYTRQGNTFVEVAKTSEKKTAEARNTGMKWKDSKGKSYDIFMSSRGSCFVKRISAKTGKEYRPYLGAELSQEICKELKVEHKGKTK